MSKWTKQLGFTLTEVLIIAPIVILVIGTFIVFIVNITGEVLKAKSSIDTVSNTQDALSYIQADVKLATGFTNTTGTVTSPQGSGDDATAWTNSGATSTNLILKRLATDKSPLNPASAIIYANTPAGCADGNRQQNAAYIYYSVYYLKTTSGIQSLWQRTVMKDYATSATTATLCAVPWQLPSCTYSTIAGSPTVCKVEDVKVIDNVSTFNVQYFNSTGTAVSTATREDATNIKITLGTSKAVAGQTLTSSDELRVAKRGSELPAQVATTNSVTWTPCPMSNSWTTYTGYPTVAVTKTSTGAVVMSGFFMKTAAPVGDETMCTLPVGYRPSTRLIFQLGGGGGAARVDVLTTGEVRYESGGGPSPSFVSAAGITFLSSATVPIGNWTSLTPWNLPSYNNGWVSFDNGTTFGVPAVTKDSIGRAWMQGLTKSGCTTSGCGVYGLPTGYGINASECQIYPDWNSSVASSLSPQGSVIIFRYGSNSWWSLQAMYYPDGAAQWTTPQLQNGWVPYAAGCWGSAAYVKGTDNIVSLKGLVKSGSASAAVFTLPAGYRPARTDVYCAVNTYNAAGDAHAAIWVQPNGDVVAYGSSATWLSLAGCNFVAEQ